jgi:hypothetical protein
VKTRIYKSREWDYPVTPLDEDWINLKRTGNVQYAHCRHCIADLPEGESPESYSSLEAVMDLDTGVITIGCKRHQLPIISAMLPSDLVKHMNGCGCAHCAPEQNQGD